VQVQFLTAPGHIVCFIGLCSITYLEANMTTSRFSIAMLTAALTVCPAVQGIDAQAPGGAMKAVMTAKLIDPDKKASARAATVEVTVSGVELTDPAVSNEKPVPGQGHLHYQLDKGPVIATPTAKLSFHELAPGPHTILIVLAGNDHKPLGPQQQLTVNVPAQAQKASY
jgi:hypothetical protein